MIARRLAIACVAVLMAACGLGGNSPGSNSASPTNPNSIPFTLTPPGPPVPTTGEVDAEKQLLTEGFIRDPLAGYPIDLKRENTVVKIDGLGKTPIEVRFIRSEGVVICRFKDMAVPTRVNYALFVSALEKLSTNELRKKYPGGGCR